MTARQIHGAPGAHGPHGRLPVRRLTVLYDAGCSLCVHLRHWLGRQRQLVPLTLVAAGSEQARRRYPGLDHSRTLREITVIGDRGQVYSGAAAWVVCLWALAEHRPKAHWLATPAGAPFVRVTMLAAAKYRELSGSGPGPVDAGAGAGVRAGPGDVAGAGSGAAAPCDDRCAIPR
ncbi:DCC1-like thiol-disulfide oxidoreductase family protein [Streptomyces sp. NPDC001985]|uniref:thiol-disulfide oxidoreductase DCC family protein n=1 Tax=Streptomyces sp. NPDC001985 TaxID=3154406 RepID=UPI003331F102